MTEDDIPEEPEGSFDLASEYPGVVLAYDFVRPSYEYAARRFDALETRIRGMLTVALTLTVAAPTVGRALLGERADFGSLWFIATMFAAGILGLLGAVGHFGWRLEHYDPERIYNEMLGLDDWEFRHKMLHAAKLAFIHNKRTLARMGLVADGMVVTLIIEVALLTGWISTLP